MIALEARATDLYDVIRGCTMCALSQSRLNAVPGEGPLDAEVMCIGEAPGVNEDKQGRPFVGAAGQFLEELLGAAGLARDEVYICNVLKCRPPGNRDPLPNEIESCSEYLDLQLDMVDPLVVVTLGRFSMSKWFPQQAISRIHGNVKEADGRLIVPMYHPAAALHQGSLRQVLLDDFAKLPRVLERARAARGPRDANPGPGETAQLRGGTSEQESTTHPALTGPGTDGISTAAAVVSADMERTVGRIAPGGDEPRNYVEPSPAATFPGDEPGTEENVGRMAPSGDEPRNYLKPSAEETPPAENKQQQLSLFE